MWMILLKFLNNAKILQGLSIALAIGSVYLFVNLGVQKVKVYTLEEELEECRKEVATLSIDLTNANKAIELQNKRVEELGKLTEEYLKKLKAAESTNKKVRAELEKKKKEIAGILLPTECAGKVDVLKAQLIELAK